MSLLLFVFIVLIRQIITADILQSENGKVLATSSQVTTNGVSLGLYNFTNQGHQLWELVSAGNDAFYIKPSNAPGYCLEVDRTNYINSDVPSKVQVWGCWNSNDNHQKWYITTNPYRIQSFERNLCIDVFSNDYNSNIEGAGIQLWDCHSENNQIFYQINTKNPTKNTLIPTSITIIPSINTVQPSLNPTYYPTKYPTNGPTFTKNPTNIPTIIPTNYPTNIPTNNPTQIPTQIPTIITTIFTTKNEFGKKTFTIPTETIILLVLIAGGLVLMLCITILILIIIKKCKKNKSQLFSNSVVSISDVDGNNTKNTEKLKKLENVLKNQNEILTKQKNELEMNTIEKNNEMEDYQNEGDGELIDDDIEELVGGGTVGNNITTKKDVWDDDDTIDIDKDELSYDITTPQKIV